MAIASSSNRVFLANAVFSFCNATMFVSASFGNFSKANASFAWDASASANAFTESNANLPAANPATAKPAAVARPTLLAKFCNDLSAFRSPFGSSL
jgi:hypothetical protein